MKYSILAIAIIILAGCIQTPTGYLIKEPDSVKIAAIIPLSGENSFYGEWVMNGMNLAIEEINNNGGINGKTLKPIYEDSPIGNKKAAVNAYTKLIRHDKIPVTFSMFTGVILALAPIAEQEQSVLIALGSKGESISYAGDYVFRHGARISYEVKKLADFAKTKYNRACIMYLNGPGGMDAKEFFSKAFGNTGATEAFEETNKDHRTQLMKIKHDTCDTVYLASHIGPIPHIIRQMQELGMNKSLLAIDAESEEILDLQYKSDMEIFYTMPHFDKFSKDPKISEFQKKYRQKYGYYSPVYGALAYDTTMIIAEILKICDKSPDCIKEQLYNIQFKGVTGPVSFDENGDALKQIDIKTVKNKEFTIIS